MNRSISRGTGPALCVVAEDGGYCSTARIGRRAPDGDDMGQPASPRARHRHAETMDALRRLDLDRPPAAALRLALEGSVEQIADGLADAATAAMAMTLSRRPDELAAINRLLRAVSGEIEPAFAGREPPRAISRDGYRIEAGPAWIVVARGDFSARMTLDP